MWMNVVFQSKMSHLGNKEQAPEISLVGWDITVFKENSNFIAFLFFLNFRDSFNSGKRVCYLYVLKAKKEVKTC